MSCTVVSNRKSAGVCVYHFKWAAQRTGTPGHGKDIKSNKGHFTLTKKTKQTHVEYLNHSLFQLVPVNALHLEQRRGGYEYILLIMDHYTQAYATTNESAKIVADGQIVQWFLFHVWFPRKCTMTLEDKLLLHHLKSTFWCPGISH